MTAVVTAAREFQTRRHARDASRRRADLGACVCGLPVDDHFDAFNRMRGCAHAASVNEQGRDAARCVMHQEGR